MDSPTFQQLTAPGYFNFSGTQLPATKKISDWFNLSSQIWADQANLMDSFFRLWLTHDYSTATITRTPYVQYKLQQWGLGWISLPDTQAVAIVGYVSRGYSTSTATNIQFLFEFIAAPPLVWCNLPIQIVYGQQYPAIFSETLIIYSNSVTPPSTPSSQPYIERDWDPPVGWTQFASESTYFSRGYLDSGNIIWMDPQPTNVVYPFYNVATVGDLPASPDIGSLGSVEDDGSGDVSAVYYFDGVDWQKTTTQNVNQGLVAGGVIPDPQPRAVNAPNPDTNPTPIISQNPPPVTGGSQGYGMYGGLAQIVLSANEIIFQVELTSAGFDNLGIIVNLLRRIKPTLNNFILVYTIEGSSDPATQINIKDQRAV